MNSSGKLMTSLLRALEVALIGLALFFLVKAVMVWLNPSSAWKTPKPGMTTQGVAVSQDGPKIDYGFDPFHREAVDNVAVVDASVFDDAPETTLNLKLKGHITGKDNRQRVTLETPDRKQKGYGIGDEVTEGVTIKGIFPGHVLLSRDGKTEKLTFDKASTESLSKKPEYDATFKTDMRIPGGVSPAQLLSNLSFEPVNNNNRVVGYKIKSASGLDLRKIGFRDGDVITKIGGKDLTAQGTDLKSTIIEAAMSGRTTAQITRKGRKMTIRVKLP